MALLKNYIYILLLIVKADGWVRPPGPDRLVGRQQISILTFSSIIFSGEP